MWTARSRYRLPRSHATVALGAIGGALACGFPDVSFDGAGDAGAESDASSNGEWVGQPWNEAGGIEANAVLPSDDSAASRLGDHRDALEPDATVLDTAIGSSGSGSSSGGGGASSASSSSGGGGSGGSGSSSSGSGTGSSSSSSGSGASGSSGGSNGGGASSSSGGSSNGSGSGDSGVAGGSACVCASGQTLYAPTGFDCAAIVIDPQLAPGQAKKACKNAAGFLESTLACSQLGTYLTCDAVADVAGIGLVCQVATRTSVMQHCH